MAAPPRWTGYAWAVAAAVLGTLVGYAIEARFDLVNIAMVYLLAVVIVALRYSHGPAVVAAVLALGLPSIPLAISLLGHFALFLALELTLLHRRTSRRS